MTIESFDGKKICENVLLLLYVAEQSKWEPGEVYATFKAAADAAGKVLGVESYDRIEDEKSLH